MAGDEFDRVAGERDHEGGEELDRLRREVERLTAALDAERRNAAQWQQLAEERRVTLERLRQRRIVRVLLRVASAVLPTARRVQHRSDRAARSAARLGRAVARLPGKLTAPRRAQALERAVRALPAPDPDPRSVSVVVLTRDGADRLPPLLAALAATGHEHVEVIVHDNASGAATRRVLATASGITVRRSETNLTFADACNAAAAEATGEVLCFLNDDVVPLEAGWLARMLAHLHGEVVAVGAQLVYPPRPLLEARTRDLSVQHLGIGLFPAAGGVPRARHLGRGDAPDPHLPAREVAAATAACLVVQRTAFEDAGGFDGRYRWGAEDVDLCWRLRQAGGRVVVAPSAVLYHHEGATRLREDGAAARNTRQARNWELFESRFGPALRRAVTLDRLTATHRLCPDPYRLGITVTRDLESAGYGDWYTAHELGAALDAAGIEVRYLERYRDAWYTGTGDLDAIVVLHDLFDVRRVARPGLATVAWVRNWTERWLSQPWFDHLDAVLASSARSAELIRDGSRHRPAVVPLATDPQRFRPDAAGGAPRSGAVFAGNHWGHDRGIGALVRAVPELEVYGRGWDADPDVAPRWRGQLAYDELPRVYAGALVVVDQTATPTRPYGAVNARVLDALAAGALPVTDQVQGAEELFGGELPTWRDPEELGRVVRARLDDPEGTAALARRLRDRVLDAHTYARRAAALRDLLVEREQRPRVDLRTSCPDRRTASSWGDWHLAHALGAELRARGYPVTVATMDEWHTPVARAADVAIHLKGRSKAPRYEGQVHVIWNISHPEELTDAECGAADLVLVAGARFAGELRRRTTTRVEVLEQATDERRFRPCGPDPRYAHDVAFVGNSRHVLRAVVRDALAAGLEVAICGANWERYVDPRLVRATHVPNDELPRVYSSVKVLLNDHWEGMRRWGFVSNRIFDALACGAVVVSDEMEELAAFGGAVRTYRTPDGLRRAVEELLADEELRRELGRKGREVVLAAHTFSHRAERLLELLAPLLTGR